MPDMKKGGEGGGAKGTNQSEVNIFAGLKLESISMDKLKFANSFHISVMSGRVITELPPAVFCFLNVLHKFSPCHSL